VTAVSARPAYGWTFLVARGRHQGYQPLLVPDFLAESNEYGVLDQATGGDPTAASAIARVHGLAAGDVVLAYRSQRLTDADLGDSPGDPLTDEFGRPLELLYGFVVRAAGIGELDDADFAIARAEAVGSYQRFLTDESGFELETSKPFVLRSVPAAPEPVPSTVSAAPPDAVPARAPAAEPAPVAAARSPIARRNVVLIALLVVALSASAWFLLLRGRGGPVTDVEISKLTSSTVDCSLPITVQATVTTDAKATVTYHWQSTLSTDSGPVALEFEAAATKSVETTVQPQAGASSGDRFTFTQTLVVDEPNSTESSGEFTVTCR